MMGKLRFATCASVLGLGASLFTAGSALASGFALREESAEGLGNAFAGQTAKAYNASTVFYNPAGMSNLDHNEVASTVSWIAPVAKFSGSNTNAAAPTTNVVGTQPSNAIKAAAVGTVFGVYQINPEWTLGLSVAAPYGMRSDYKADWVGRYQALHSDVTDIEFSPVLSYKIDNHFSVGGGPRVDYIDATLSQAINKAALGSSGDGSGKIWGDDTGVGYVLSGLYKFDDTSRVGLTYRSRVQHTLSGSVQYDNMSTGLLNAIGQKNQDVTAKITLPDSLTAGIYHELNDQWAVMSDVTWTHWSLFKNLTVMGANGATVSNTHEQWQNTYFVSLGANFKPNDKWVLHTGVAYDQSAVTNDFRTARIPDTNRYWTSFGATYNVSPDANVSLAYAHLFADSATINEKNNSLSGTLTGTYDNSVDIVSASFVLKF